MNTGPHDDPYGEHSPMNVVREMWRGDPAGIPINEPVVLSSEVFTRPHLSGSAPVRGRNGPFIVGNTPTMRFTGDAAQMSGMRVGSSYYDQIEMSTPPNGNPGHTMSISSFHQRWSSPHFPSIPQAQSLISMQSSDPAEPSSDHTFSFDGFEHTTMGASSSRPDQSTNFNQNPYYYHLQPSVGAPSSVQGGHSSRSTCIYESAPTVSFSGRSHYDLRPPTTSDMCTASCDQVQPSFITSDFDGYEHMMGISSSYPNPPPVFMQNPYHSYWQPSVGAPSSVQGGHSSASTCIYRSTPTIGLSRGDRYNLGTNTNLNTASSAQVQPALITADADGYGHTMGISTAHSNQPTVFIQNLYHHGLVQPPIGIAGQVQALTPSSGSACIDKSAASVDLSREDHDDSSEDSERPECQVCHKTFSSECHLERHSMIHTNKKPFECKVCDLKFARKDHLKRHYNRVHLALKRFKCEVCARSFYFKYELDRHNCSVT